MLPAHTQQQACPKWLPIAAQRMLQRMQHHFVRGFDLSVSALAIHLMLPAHQPLRPHCPDAMHPDVEVGHKVLHPT
eukprot:5959267-Amphidinium_carterae.1